jgi:hypothetical protein
MARSKQQPSAPPPALLIFSINTTQTSITGGCYSGAVRFQAAQAPLSQTTCHCANCRRAISAPSVAWITVNRADFHFAQGNPKRYRTDTGAWRTFCAGCGTSLTYENDTRPDEVDITTGSLDHPEDSPPTRDYFTEEKLPWIPLIDDAKC